MTPSVTPTEYELIPYALSDRYDLTEGRVFLTGTQALVRILLDQRRRDRAAGWNTAGFVSGYRGSPLGGLDKELWANAARLKAEGIRFVPAVNEDLGATAVLGAQQASLEPECEVEGVVSMWYGKGPGVDRSGDALKHGNAYGSAPRGGVLVVAGDDHGCVSSSMPHQSDVAFMAWFMPCLSPASVAEYAAFGEWGIALSRFAGVWTGFKAISETVESGASVTLGADRQFHIPDIDMPPGGLHVRLADLPSTGIETRIGHKLRAVQAFAEANPIDQRIYALDDAVFGIVTAGKAHLDTLEALRLLGIDEACCRERGIDLYKVGMVWPLALRDALAFVKAKREVLVIEEKRGIVESQLKEAFYDWPGDKPARMVGKHDETMAPLVPWTGELSALALVPVIAARLAPFVPDLDLPARARALTAEPPRLLDVSGATRKPYFCSGCPHNSSTRVPDGSKATSGIGCHVMASWMDRRTAGFAQMGGEGVPWIAASAFSGDGHLFQNMGEGTWYHSGSLAVRQAVAAGTNITYKILYNDAVAMTGGQPVDGPISSAAIARSCRAEGVSRIALVTEELSRHARDDFPPGTTFHDRGELDAVQRELRKLSGVTIIVYDQVCATEARRRRKRGQSPTPARTVIINEMVCEGCGDCSVESNCLSVEPVRTPFGPKRRINQSSCNKDYSCLQGFCPSFVTVEGGTLRKRASSHDAAALVAALPTPEFPALERPWNLLVSGVGGTGVVTIGALISMAAHLEGLGSSVLDFTGFAQKFGTVLGYVRIASEPARIHQVRIERGSADAVIACDAVASSAPQASAHYRRGTRVVLNLAEMPTGDVVLDRDADLAIDTRRLAIEGAVGTDQVAAFDANRAAERLMGDPVFANVMMLGFAWQQGLVPVSEAALHRAMALNGVAPDANVRAFALGRVMAVAPERLEDPSPSVAPADDDPDALIDQRAAFLSEWGGAKAAARFRAIVARFRAACGDDALTVTAARSLFRLMAYKDEYEVARLHADPAFAERVAEMFEGEVTLSYHLAPTSLAAGKDARGRPIKRRFGPWMGRVFAGLARARRLRGTALDPFRFQADRRLDRELIDWFEAELEALPSRDIPADAKAGVAGAPMDIRGYGPVREAAARRVREEVAQLTEARATVPARRADTAVEA